MFECAQERQTSFWRAYNTFCQMFAPFKKVLVLHTTKNFIPNKIRLYLDKIKHLCLNNSRVRSSIRGRYRIIEQWDDVSSDVDTALSHFHIDDKVDSVT